MSLLYNTIVNDIMAAKLESLTVKDAMAVCQIIAAREDDFRRSVAASLKNACTDEEFGRIIKKINLI